MNSEPIFLYIEDDPTSRDVMEMTLKFRMGFSNITIWEDSTDFGSRIANLSPRPTLVFMDIHVRPYDGFEMLDILRHHSGYDSTLVIAVTASVMSEEVDQLKSAGFNGVIAKPLDPDEFPELLKRILNGEVVWYISS